MAVLIYFLMMITVVLFGIGILALTFRQWYIDYKQKKRGEL